MQVTVNGDIVQLDDNASLIDLLSQLQLADAKIAVELNHAIVSRSQYRDQALKDNDQLEIVHAIGGG
ncbi:MAG: sulfur carrier protein ThiS [Gammaproteobacteria bacterium]